MTGGNPHAARREDPRPIQLLVLGIDGVLTDGRILITAGGVESRAIAAQDVDAVFEARRMGLTVALVCGEHDAFAASLARRLEVTTILMGARDRVAAVHELARTCFVDLSEVCYVGASDRDASALAVVGLGLAPATASMAAKEAADRVLASGGGSGAVLEAIAHVRERNIAAARVAASPDSPPSDAGADVRHWARESADVIRRTADDVSEAIVEAARLIREALAAGRKVLVFGNGGSASDSQHLAAELVGRFVKERGPLAVIALTGDASVLTALANDYGDRAMFARQVEALGQPGDVAIAISTSGRSRNVLAAMEACRERRVTTIGITGRDGGGIPELADVCIVVPAEDMSRIHESHGFIIHALCGLIEKDLPPQAI